MQFHRHRQRFSLFNSSFFSGIDIVSSSTVSFNFVSTNDIVRDVYVPAVDRNRSISIKCRVCSAHVHRHTVPITSTTPTHPLTSLRSIQFHMFPAEFFYNSIFMAFVWLEAHVQYMQLWHTRAPASTSWHAVRASVCWVDLCTTQFILSWVNYMKLCHSLRFVTFVICFGSQIENARDREREGREQKNGQRKQFSSFSWMNQRNCCVDVCFCKFQFFKYFSFL